MDDASFRGDCTRCIGLCCVALAFDRGPQFAFDKPPGVACPLLRADHRCAVHASLDEAGLGGCRHYDCLGAGQIVVTEVFPGRSWREGPVILRAFLNAFALMREVQELRLAARQLGLMKLCPELEPAGGWTYARLLSLDLGAMRRKLRDSLQD